MSAAAVLIGDLGLAGGHEQSCQQQLQLWHLDPGQPSE